MKKEERKLTEYAPSKTELRLLEVLINPASRLRTVTEICKLAKIARQTYYEIFKRPEFCALYRSLSLDIIKRNTGPLVNTLIREANRGSAQHLKMALEMAYMYVEKRRDEKTGKDGGPIILKFEVEGEDQE
jgi:hypothetical protein